ncbi:MAG: hypothetical protein H0V02_05080 [Nocardioidaceae bacterium]|nr:hypothetical protein [Nocardioidaceae bacterium]
MSDQWPPSSPSPDPPSSFGGQPSYGHFGGGPQPAAPYPQQQLLPQEVQPGRSRLPLVIGLVVVLALIGGGVAAWFLLRDEGEDTRAEYCAGLKELTNDGDLLGVVGAADESTLVQLEKVADLAPSAVEADWQRLRDLAASEEFTASSGFAAYAAFQSIVRDAEDKCGMDIPLPSF